MAIDTGRVGILSDLLLQAGIPIATIQFVDESIPTVNLVYTGTPTPEQIALALQIVADFPWDRRRPRSRNDVVGSLQNLTQAQRNQIQLHLMAQILRDHPEYAAGIGRFLDAPIVVDEVDPT
jgi:hypothetical protein